MYQNLSKVLKNWHDTWKKEYLTSLLDRKIHRTSKAQIDQNIKVGEVVLIYSDKPRDSWALGKIEECFSDQQRIIRAVKLKTKLGSVIRTMNKLYGLKAATKHSTMG